MGSLLSKVWTKFFGMKNIKILMFGLDAAGITTILYKLKIDEIIITISTIGFNFLIIEYKNITFTMWNVGGQYKIRLLWRNYY